MEYILSAAIVILTIMIFLLYKQLNIHKEESEDRHTLLCDEVERLRFIVENDNSIIARHYGRVKE